MWPLTAIVCWFFGHNQYKITQAITEGETMWLCTVVICKRCGERWQW